MVQAGSLYYRAQGWRGYRPPQPPGDDGWSDKHVNAFLMQPFVNYNLKDGWYLVSAPMNATQRTPTLPMDEQLRFAVGTQRTVSQDFTFGSTFELLDLGNNNINQDRVVQGNLYGDYSSRVAFVLGPNAALKF